MWNKIKNWLRKPATTVKQGFPLFYLTDTELEVLRDAEYVISCKNRTPMVCLCIIYLCESYSEADQFDKLAASLSLRLKISEALNGYCSLSRYMPMLPEQDAWDLRLEWIDALLKHNKQKDVVYGR